MSDLRSILFEAEDKTFELEFAVLKGCAANIRFGDPDSWSPAESGEIDVVRIVELLPDNYERRLTWREQEDFKAQWWDEICDQIMDAA